MYRKTYFCACEGQQEEMYLIHLASLLKQFPTRVVTFNKVHGSAEKLEKNYVESDSAALFDYDFNDTAFGRNISLCEKLNRQYVRKRSDKGTVFYAYSKVNIDLWFVLHKEDYNKPVSSSHAYVADVRRIYGLSSEADIKEKANSERILTQISLDDIRSAISHAEHIRDVKLPVDRFMVGSIAC